MAEGLEEAVDLGVASAERHLGDYGDATTAERAALRRSVREVLLAAAPAIRKQECQRIREALLTALAPAQTGDFKIRLSAVRDILDTLEDSDA
jgi:hypothetical protein